jgi:hypothetical protein
VTAQLAIETHNDISAADTIAFVRRQVDKNDDRNMIISLEQ